MLWVSPSMAGGGPTLWPHFGRVLWQTLDACLTPAAAAAAAATLLL